MNTLEDITKEFYVQAERLHLKSEKIKKRAGYNITPMERLFLAAPSNAPLVERALEFYGEKEIPGKDNNPAIVEMIQRVWHWAKDDEIPWCGFFMNAIADDCGFETPKEPGLARNWLDVGNVVSKPKLGDTVVFWRKSIDSNAGHVALFISKVNNYIYVLGGNQSNSVNISAYHISRLLGYRRLHKIDQITGGDA